MSDPRLGGDHDVLSALVEWDAAGDVGVMVTVVRTWGSSPRPPGSLLAIRLRDGKQVGSVSGGCVEGDLVERCLRGELADCPTTVDYGVDPAGAARFGLPCGGQLELLLEQPEASSLQHVAKAIESGELIERRVCLKTGEVSLHRAATEVEFRFAEETAYKTFGPQWQLLLVGAGEIADHLARMALTLGFRVSICDPRDGQASTVPGVQVVRDMPDDAVNGLAKRHRTAVITLAHDPRLDDMALMDALRQDFFYVGALGSKRTSAARRERLGTLDVTASQIARLRAPVGLDIGSQTPPEIAIAIAADLIAARHGLVAR